MSIPLSVANFTAPGEAVKWYAECGFNYCVPNTICTEAISHATKLHYFVEVGFIAMALCMILFCEHYRRKAKRLEKEKQAGVK